MGLRRFRVEFKSPSDGVFGPGKYVFPAGVSIVVQEKKGVRKTDPGERVARVGRDRALEVVERLLQSLGAPLIQ